LSVTTNEEQDANPIIKRYILENRDTSYSFDKVYQEKYDDSYDAVMLARNLFDLREFKKCAHLVARYAKNPAYQSAIFLYYYSLFMAGEMRKEEEMYENGKKEKNNKIIFLESNPKGTVNQELALIEMELAKLYQQDQLNELNLYLYGLVLKEKMKKEEAKEVFIKVLNMFPCFWSAWLELCKLIEGEDHVNVEEKD